MKEINPGQDLSRQKTEAGTSLGAELLGLEHCRYFQKEREHPPRRWEVQAESRPKARVGQLLAPQPNGPETSTWEISYIFYVKIYSISIYAIYIMTVYM